VAEDAGFLVVNAVGTSVMGDTLFESRAGASDIQRLLLVFLRLAG
jgi:hypothetical protein